MNYIFFSLWKRYHMILAGATLLGTSSLSTLGVVGVVIEVVSYRVIYLTGPPLKITSFSR